MARKVKGVGKPSAAKISADKRKQQEEHLAQAQKVAFDKAYKQRMILAAKMAGRAKADAEIAKKGKK
jgi:hypothetical protein